MNSMNVMDKRFSHPMKKTFGSGPNKIEILSSKSYPIRQARLSDYSLMKDKFILRDYNYSSSIGKCHPDKMC